MAENAPQSYGNHRKFVPLYHFLTATILLVNLVWTVWNLTQALLSEKHVFRFDLVMGVLIAVALILMFFYLRTFALTVQDRVIRQEMRLRLREVLPEDLAGRIDELKRGQVVGLRFASDAEMPDLVREALDQRLGGEAIKKKIKDWRADHFRC
ncbi:MAG: hypothetical protein GY719_14090 [bacterium]|nr:hypothetical protein [bacterium]